VTDCWDTISTTERFPERFPPEDSGFGNLEALSHFAMETLLETDIPYYVKDSEYLISLLNNGPFPCTGIEVPRGCAKKDQIIESASDLTELLQTLRFWIVPVVLETCGDFLRFAFDPQNRTVLRERAIEYEITIPFVHRVDTMASSSPILRVKQAISYGYLFVLRFLYEELKCEVEGGIMMAAEADQVGCLEYFHSRGELLTPQLAAEAAKANSLQCLTYIHDFGGVCDFSALTSAVANGSLKCVKFLVQNISPFSTKELNRLLHRASNGGHLAVVEYLWDACSDLRNASSEERVHLPAALRGHLPLLQFARARSFLEFASPPSSAVNIMNNVAIRGHLRCMEWLYSVGQRAGSLVLKFAAGAGHILLVRFLLEHHCPVDPNHHIAEALLRSKHVSFSEAKVLLETGIPWDAMTMAALAEKGDLRGMTYLRERGCPWDEETCGRAAWTGQLECLRFARENGCPWRVEADPQPLLQATITEQAALAPSLDCLKYAVAQGAPLVCGAVHRALEKQSLPTLQYLLSVGCPLDARAFQIAAVVYDPRGTDPLVFLRLLQEHHCPWDVATCRAAAQQRNLEVLRFAHENGCPWDATVCASAALAASLECLQYAHTNGCLWDERTCASAAEAKSYKVLKYARERGCPWDVRTSAAAAGPPLIRVQGRTGVSLAFLKHVREQGCSWDEDTFRRADSREVYEYAVAHGCPGAELSRFHNPAYVEIDPFEEMAYLMDLY